MTDRQLLEAIADAVEVNRQQIRIVDAKLGGLHERFGRLETEITHLRTQVDINAQMLAQQRDDTDDDRWWMHGDSPPI